MDDRAKQPQINREHSCPMCGTLWIGASSTCPQCNSFGKAGDEMTKKVLDEPDLKKGL